MNVLNKQHAYAEICVQKVVNKASELFGINMTSLGNVRCGMCKSVCDSKSTWWLSPKYKRRQGWQVLGVKTPSSHSEPLHLLHST